MKPSQRINEIANERYSVPSVYEGLKTIDSSSLIKALIDYLDEEWDKKQPCVKHSFATEERDERCTRCGRPRFTPV